MPSINPKEIVMLFVMLVIGGSLLGPLARTVFLTTHINDSGFASNVTGAAAAIVSLLTLFFVIIIIMIVVRKIRG